MPINLPKAVLLRLDAIDKSGAIDANGDRAGTAWRSGLADLIDSLATRWSFSTGDVLSGGTQALVIEATLATGDAAVLKILVPAVPEPGQKVALENTESRVLRAAKGRGYVRLLAADDAVGAMLLERLGDPLGLCESSVSVQQRSLCNALQLAWRTSTDDLQLQTGAEKAVWLRALITELARAHADVILDLTVETAIEFTHEREAAHESAQKVLVHGDAHEFNALKAADGSYRLIDPDGLYAEPEYDLGVLTREANLELLTEQDLAPISLGLERCEYLAELTGTNPHAIWQWGFIERVSSGLYTIALNMPEYGKPALAIANSWAEQGARSASFEPYQFEPYENDIGLPPLEVRASQIHGQGLFTVQAISKGALIGVCQVEPADPPGPHTLWCDAGPVNVVCKLRFTNHSNEPSVVYYDSLRVVALRDIGAGEELTYNYGSVDFE